MTRRVCAVRCMGYSLPKRAHDTWVHGTSKHFSITRFGGRLKRTTNLDYWVRVSPLHFLIVFPDSFGKMDSAASFPLVIAAENGVVMIIAA